MHEAAFVATGSRTAVGSWVPTDLARSMAELAREHDRSMSGEIRLALRKYIAEHRSSGASIARSA